MPTVILKSKYTVFSLSLCLAFLSLAMAESLRANPNKNTTTTKFCDVTTAKYFVEKLIRDAKSIAENSKSGPQEFGKFLEQNTNVEIITSFILGPFAKKLTPEESNEFTEIYRKRLIKNYSTPEKIKTFTGSQFSFQGNPIINKDSSVTVKTIFTFNSNAKPVKINFVVITKKNNLYIKDITFDGISKLSAERSEYQAVVKRFINNNSFQSAAFLKYLASTILVNPVATSAK